MGITFLARVKHAYIHRIAKDGMLRYNSSIWFHLRFNPITTTHLNLKTNLKIQNTHHNVQHHNVQRSSEKCILVWSAFPSTSCQKHPTFGTALIGWFASVIAKDCANNLAGFYCVCCFGYIAHAPHVGSVNVTKGGAIHIRQPSVKRTTQGHETANTNTFGQGWFRRMAHFSDTNGRSRTYT